MSGCWVIAKPLEVRSRIKIDGVRPMFANFDARLLPSEDHAGILVVEAWSDSADRKWLPAIQEGVDRFVQQRADLDRPVANTTLVMTRVIAHPVDTDARAVAYNVNASLHSHFDKNEVRVRFEE